MGCACSWRGCVAEGLRAVGAARKRAGAAHRVAFPLDDLGRREGERRRRGGERGERNLLRRGGDAPLSELRRGVDGERRRVGDLRLLLVERRLHEERPLDHDLVLGLRGERGCDEDTGAAAGVGRASPTSCASNGLLMALSFFSKSSASILIGILRGAMAKWILQVAGPHCDDAVALRDGDIRLCVNGCDAVGDVIELRPNPSCGDLFTPLLDDVCTRDLGDSLLDDVCTRILLISLLDDVCTRIALIDVRLGRTSAGGEPRAAAAIRRLFQGVHARSKRQRPAEPRCDGHDALLELDDGDVPREGGCALDLLHEEQV